MTPVPVAAQRPSSAAVALALATACGLATACVPEGWPSFATPTATEEGAPELLAGSPVELLDGTYDVRYTVDGDTFLTEIDGQRVSVRLIGIDAPEVARDGSPGQCFADQATVRARELLGGARVTLGLDPTQDQFDRHGRLLAYAWLADGRLVNLAMLNEGLAYEFTYDRNRPYAFARAFRAARHGAEAEGVGLWSAGTCRGRLDAPPVP
jgi:micrococcal nuclease